ncbi:MAG: hypothetical protein ACOH13_00875 [Flavobacteriales bacterium]
MKRNLLAAILLLCTAWPAAAYSFHSSLAGAAARGGGCDPPVALLTTAQGDTVRACPGDIIMLDGSASYPSAGHNIQQWIWDLGNGMSDTTTSAFHSVALPEGGYFVFGLQVIDEAGCASLQQVRVTAFVSRRPVFTGTLVPDTICPGATVILTGSADQLPLVPTHIFAPASPLALSDNWQAPSSFPIEVSGAGPSDTISDADQLGDICIDMEHSFMGDFVLSITCPNGNNVILHQQGGGGTYLGEPVDGDDTDPVPGICYTYCFNTHPDNGTWVASAAQGQSLAPGTYTSIDSLSGLIGCPVNGTWTLNFTDLWLSDNGFLCSWSLGLYGFFLDSLNHFGPVLGTASPDSSFWSGTGILNDAAIAGSASYSPPGAGVQQLTFTVMDSYACSFDTLVTIAVVPIANPVVEPSGNEDELCATNTFPATYTWYFNGVDTGVEADCWMPPEPGLVTAMSMDTTGCSASTDYLVSAVGELGETWPILVAYASMDHSIRIEANGLTSATVQLRISDMVGRMIWVKQVHPESGHLNEHIGKRLASGTYNVLLMDSERVISRNVAVP